MKPLIMLIAAAITFGSLAVINSSLSIQKPASYTFVRVRTVPGNSSSEEKKKENDNTSTPQQESKSSKKTAALFCSQTNTLKTTLAISNGGSPK